MLKQVERKIAYAIALTLSILTHKTFEALARETGQGGDALMRSITKHPTTMHDLIRVARVLFKGKKVSLVLDDTLINKQYSRVIEGTSDNYSSSEGRINRSLCTVVAVLTDGQTSIPIDHHIWTAKEFDPSKYKTKTELAQELIIRIRQIFPIKLIIADGAYAVKTFMQWLNENNLSFEMRFHSNRIIEKKGLKAAIRNHPALQLKRGRIKRTTRANWNSMLGLYFTSHRRQLKNGRFTIVFLVSNFKATSSQHVEFYRHRWGVEKFFRTAKQKLGLGDCQSRKLERQNAHIFKVFLAYAVAQHERIKYKLPNAERAIKSIREKNLQDSNYAIHRFSEVLRYV
jgi:SRSO17 transposase